MGSLFLHAVRPLTIQIPEIAISSCEKITKVAAGLNTESRQLHLYSGLSIPITNAVNNYLRIKTLLEIES